MCIPVLSTATSMDTNTVERVAAAINSYMVANLLLERHRAENLPYDKKRLYDLGDFDERGFSKVQFMKFFELGTRRVFSGKEFISQENREIDKL